MEARSVMIHQIQFSSFFLFISHMPVKAAAEVKLSAMGTVLSVKTDSAGKRKRPSKSKKDQMHYSSPFGGDR